MGDGSVKVAMIGLLCAHESAKQGGAVARLPDFTLAGS
jgi:hypothetical protein